MDQEKIEQIEGEIKELFLSNSNKNWGVFWDVHVKPVIEKSKEMAMKYGGDLEIVWLSAIMHDMGQLKTLKAHDVAGSEMAYELLIEKGYTKEKAQSIKETIFTHSAKEHVPKSIEQKILASADAICHFTTPFYLWFARVNENELEDTLNKIEDKIERDFNEKIFFENERDSVKNQYDILKEWFDCKNDFKNI